MTQMIMINTDSYKNTMQDYIVRQLADDGINEKSYLIIHNQRHQRSISIFNIL